MRMAFDPPLSRTSSSAVPKSNADVGLIWKAIAPLLVAISNDEPSKSSPTEKKSLGSAKRVTLWSAAISPLRVLPKPVKVWA